MRVSVAALAQLMAGLALEIALLWRDLKKHPS
jgi:hypothetical protein